MLYVLASILSLSIIFLAISFYCRFRDVKEFRDDKLIESPLIRYLIDAVVPPKGTSKYLKFQDYITILYDKWTIRDYYFAKIVILLCSSTIGLIISGTQMLDTYRGAFDINEKLPIAITSEEYKSLSKNLTFQEAFYDRDLETLRRNIGALPLDLHSKYPLDNARFTYEYLGEIHHRLSSVLSFGNLLSIIICSLLGWFLPNVILKFCFNYLDSNRLFEYDSLESDIAIHADKSVSEILKVLKNNSKFYRNILHEFYNIYENNSEIAYSMIEYRKEFPKDFKRLCRYLNMIDTQGPHYVRDLIDNNKKQTEEEIYNLMRSTTRKNLKRLQLVSTLAFLCAVARVVISLFASYL